MFFKERPETEDFVYQAYGFGLTALTLIIAFLAIVLNTSFFSPTLTGDPFLNNNSLLALAAYSACISMALAILKSMLTRTFVNLMGYGLSFAVKGGLMLIAAFLLMLFVSLSVYLETQNVNNFLEEENKALERNSQDVYHYHQTDGPLQ